MILFDFLFQQSPSDGYVPTKNALIAPYSRSKAVLVRTRSYAPSFRGFRLAHTRRKARLFLQYNSCAYQDAKPLQIKVYFFGLICRLA